MKGIVFTELLEMVEAKFGLEVADAIVQAAQLESEGAYTSVGTYNHKEIFALVAQLEKHIGLNAKAIFHVFGQYLFQQFYKGYPYFFEHSTDTFSFLERIEDYIHVEVLKLYKDAELPRFDIFREENTLRMIYHSERRMGDFAHGLLLGVINHFNEPSIQIVQESLSDSGDRISFTLTKNA